MGVVLLLVALPALVVMGLTLAVFDGLAAVVMLALVAGIIGSLLRAARDWDGAGAARDQHEPRDEARVAAASGAAVTVIVEPPAAAARDTAESYAA